MAVVWEMTVNQYFTGQVHSFKQALMADKSGQGVCIDYDHGLP